MSTHPVKRGDMRHVRLSFHPYKSTNALVRCWLAQNQALQSRLALQEQAGREHMEAARHSAQNLLEQLYRNQHEASEADLICLGLAAMAVLSVDLENILSAQSA